MTYATQDGDVTNMMTNGRRQMCERYQALIECCCWILRRKKAALNRQRGKVSIIMDVRTFEGVAPATGNEFVQCDADQRGFAERSNVGCYRGSFQDKLAYLFFHKWRGRKVVLWSEERRERYVVRYPYNEFEA